MFVLHLTDCPIGLRGDLTKWLLEIASGVFVGQVSVRVRDEIWSRVKEHCRNGRAVLVYDTNCEQRLDFRIHGDTWEPIDFDGIKLMLRPSVTRLKAQRTGTQINQNKGFSSASQQRSAKRFSYSHVRYPDDYVVVDIETTGLNPDTDEIIEIGAIKMIGHERKDTFNALVSTKKSIPHSVSEITGITDQMIMDSGKKINDVLVAFLLFLGDLPIVGHNIDFDRSFLLNSCSSCGLPLIVNRSIDTLSLARRLIKEGQNYKLETLATRFSIEQNRYHRSISDCETTGLLYRKLLNLMESDS